MSTPQPLPRIAVVDAATDLGDALVSEAAVRSYEVTALSRIPENMTRFSPAVTYSTLALAALPSAINDPTSSGTGPGEECARTVEGDLGAELLGSDAVFMVLGTDAGLGEAPRSDEDLAATTIRAMRRVGIDRLIVCVPLDALALTPNGVKEHGAPARRRALAEFAKPRSRRALVDTRRGAELARLSGLEVTVIAHPPIVVAPGPGSVTRVPLAYAPRTSRDMSARDAAVEALKVLRMPETAGEEFVLSAE